MNQWDNKEGRQVIQQRKQTLINRISPICFQLNAKKIFTDSQHRLQMEKRLYFLKQRIKIIRFPARYRHPYSFASGPYASTISIYKFDRPFEDQNRFTCNVIYETNIGPFRPSVGKPAALSTRLRYVQFEILYLYFTVLSK